MSSRDDNSVSGWIVGLKDGDSAAVAQLWARYFHQLVSLAERKIGSAALRVTDGEDVAASVFESLFAGAQKERFQELTDRDDLWCLLMALTRQKSTDHIRHAKARKRGGKMVRVDERLLLEIVSNEPTPQFLVEADEMFHKLMEVLPDSSLRSVAQGRMQGDTIEEIADRLECTRRTIQRKLELIRVLWSSELADEES